MPAIETFFKLDAKKNFANCEDCFIFAVVNMLVNENI